MALTYDEAFERYQNNADYEEVQSVAKARAFVTACIELLTLLPSSASDQGSSQTIDHKEIQTEKARARSFIAANAVGGRVRYLSTNTGDFR